jgi:molybdopterin-containing oxidoreductase family iron-sulfur binding subunit
MTPSNEQPLDLVGPARAADTTARAGGPAYWRSLEELADTDAFRERLHREFPVLASEWTDPLSRRRFVQLMAASLALAGLGGCARPPVERIVPYVRPPAAVVPGRPLFFATAMPLGGSATGLLVESHMGRPTKVEGNPDHPASRGATDAFAQASVLTLYDPDRSQTVLQNRQISSWDAFRRDVRSRWQTPEQRATARLRLLTGWVTSPTLRDQIETVLRQFPQAKWYAYEPAVSQSARAGARLAFGKDVSPLYRLDRAAVILALDADFLSCGPGHLRYVRDFAARRRAWSGPAEMSRLYAVEATPSNTGAVADHRLPLRAGAIAAFARDLAVTLQVLKEPPGQPPPYAAWLAQLAADLDRHRGTSLVLAGEQQPATVHVLAHALNHALGNVGQTVLFAKPADAESIDPMPALGELVQEMEQGQVEALVILGGNPVYDAPADLCFAERLAKVPWRIHLSLYDDETSELCHWHVPEAHYLETWSDTRSDDGTASILQPLIAPLYGGKSAHEVLALFTDNPEQPGYDLVRAYWRGRHRAGDFEAFWRQALHDGILPGTAWEIDPAVSLTNDWAAALKPPLPGPDLEIVFRPDPTVYDGRFANNGWLQELPKPLTKLTWDNAALVSPATAKRLGLANEDRVELRYQGRRVEAPVWVVPGHADEAVTVALGYGRWRAGRAGTGLGFNAYALRTAAAPWFDSGLVLAKTGRRYRLACTQHHHLMENRDLVRTGTLAQYPRDPTFAPKAGAGHGEESQGTSRRTPLSLYPEYPYEDYKWGMAIDLGACVGCGACVVACQAENNIPIVGKEQVLTGREMHWLRVDSYHKGAPDNPETYFQPVPCMHCENAPCEVVCPVAATVHSSEGLNDMVYNRCVGTRYCSNNCPYKVRRFNFLAYADFHTPSLQLLYNPEVTVRSRGVMEKCTYCVQRISAARIAAKKEDRRIRDGEVVTACQAVCPAGAIVFGDLNDPASQVAKRKAGPLNYGLLADLNTRPRTTYLAALRNPNPELAKSEGRGSLASGGREPPGAERR